MPVQTKDLQSFSFFKDLSPSKLEAMAQLCTWATFDFGQTLAQEKTPGKSVFLIVEGKVEISFNIGEGGLVKVDEIGREEFVGCSALVPPYDYNSTIRALTPVKTLSIDATGLQRLADQDCQLAAYLYQHLLHALVDRIVLLRLEVGR
jgi:CRP-like cAMP-binding protein